jgi:hypothetical protein
MTDPTIQTAVHPFVFADARASLGRTPGIFRTLLSGASEGDLAADEGPGTWTPRQVLCHVLHGETDDWMPRVRLLLEFGPSRSFTPFDRVAGFSIYADRTLTSMLDELSRLRAENLEALDALELGPADLAKTGRHPELGVVTLEQLIACWATHDWAHVTQIGRVLTRRYGAAVGPWKAYFSLLGP